MQIQREDFYCFYLRVVFGLAMFITHGLAKYHMIGTPDIASFPSVIGLGPDITFYINFFAEFVCSLLLVVGLFTRFAAAVLTVNMLVAAFFFSPLVEYPLLYAFAFIPFIFGGGHAISLDRLIFGKKNSTCGQACSNK